MPKKGRKFATWKDHIRFVTPAQLRAIDKQECPPAAVFAKLNAIVEMPPTSASRGVERAQRVKNDERINKFNATPKAQRKASPSVRKEVASLQNQHPDEVMMVRVSGRGSQWITVDQALEVWELPHLDPSKNLLVEKFRLLKRRRYQQNERRRRDYDEVEKGDEENTELNRPKKKTKDFRNTERTHTPLLAGFFKHLLWNQLTQQPYQLSEIAAALQKKVCERAGQKAMDVAASKGRTDTQQIKARDTARYAMAKELRKTLSPVYKRDCTLHATTKKNGLQISKCGFIKPYQHYYESAKGEAVWSACNYPALVRMLNHVGLNFPPSLP